jgi:ATP-binding cassette, subfamily B (MDR/TAP), member 1
MMNIGKIGAGEVMAVFWACLIATSNLQACIPQMILLGKGKEAVGSLKGILVTGQSPSSIFSLLYNVS